MYEDFLVRTDSLENVVENGETTGFKFAVRNANYRGIFLSLVTSFYVEMDGEEFPIDDIRFAVNGAAPRSMEELKKAVFEHWDMQDEAYLYVKKPGGLAKGTHQLGYMPGTIDGYGYKATDAEWVDNPPQPGKGGGKTYHVCNFTLELN